MDHPLYNMYEDEIMFRLVKYITGEANKKETEQIKVWLNAHPENEQYFAQLYEMWHNMLYLNTANIGYIKIPAKVPVTSVPSKPKQLKKFDYPDLLVYFSALLMLTAFVYTVLHMDSFNWMI